MTPRTRTPSLFATLGALLVAAGACATAGSAPSTAMYGAGDTIDVLFVGNSYVYYNNLPDQLEDLSARMPGGPFLRTAHHLHGGFSLQRHLEDGHLPAVLTGPAPDGDPYEVVVLQEQSTLAVPYTNETEGTIGDPGTFRQAVRQVVGMARSAHSDAVLYMTWARRDHPLQIGALASAYEEAGAELGVPVAPAGLAWARVRSERPELELYAADGSHPSPAGTYLVAAVMYASLTGRSPVGAPARLEGAAMTTPGVEVDGRRTTLVSLDADTAAYLQDVAWQTVSTYRGPGG